LSGDFVKVASQKDIHAGAMKAVEYGEESVCLANIDGKYYAMGNICTHEGGPLAEGSLDNYEVECPWHGARFDEELGKFFRLLLPSRSHHMKS